MRTETRSINIYSYQDLELDPKLKENVLSENRYINVDCIWYDIYIDNFKDILSKMGFDVEEIFFNGFYSQGDGACFTGTYRYKEDSVKHLVMNHCSEEFTAIAESLLELQKKCNLDCFCKIIHVGRYYHENSVRFEFCSEFDENQSLVDIYEPFFINQFKNISKLIYKKLQEAYEDLISDDCVLGTIESNNYEFYENGKII